MPEHEQPVTIDRVIAITGLSARTLSRLMAEGKIPAQRSTLDRRRKLVRVEDLKRYLGDVPLKNVA